CFNGLADAGEPAVIVSGAANRGFTPFIWVNIVLCNFKMSLSGACQALSLGNMRKVISSS
ncbi:hypothetical protein, partial [Acidithiobacillus thiooxidans]|uniref:hypothetical protein n=1 Tax=Acidithiobacillus thiooxidans TaxID=930 RepID=UPI001ED9C392